MRHRPIAAVVALALAGAAAGTVLAALRDSSAPKPDLARCSPGLVSAVIGGKHQCLKRGARCSRRRDREYHRYGFHCHTGRLTGSPTMPAGVIAVVALAGDAWALTAGAGAVWVQEGDSGVARIDTAENRVTARVAGVDNLAFAGDELWGAAGNRLLRLDPTTGKTLADIPLPTADAHRIVAGEASLWMPSEDVVLRVDRNMGRVETIPVRCPGSKEAAFGYGSLWLACRDADIVLRIDTTAGAVVARIPTGVGPHHIAIGVGAVWVTNYREQTISRIDPASNTAVARIAGAGAGIGITVADGLVWAATNDGVATIDPTTNAITGRLRLTGSRYYYGLAFAERSLWLSATDLRRVYRIDPAHIR